MSAVQPVILVVEDDLDLADMLSAYFRTQNYEVLTVNWGEDAVRSANATPPDLVVLDIRLPDIDGFEVARRLRTGRGTKNIPILFLTEKRERGDRMRSLELGADDYITKPFDIQELRLRIRNMLQRSVYGSPANPVTQLPDGSIVNEHLKECLNQEGWAILSVSLENLDRFRDLYGFVAADDVLRAVGLMISQAVREMGSVNDFIGHLSPTQLIVITLPGVVPNLFGQLCSRLEQSLNYFYPIKDQNHEGPESCSLSLSLGRLFSSQGPFAGLEDLKCQLFKS